MIWVLDIFELSNHCGLTPASPHCANRRAFWPSRYTAVPIAGDWRALNADN